MTPYIRKNDTCFKYLVSIEQAKLTSFRGTNTSTLTKQNKDDRGLGADNRRVIIQKTMKYYLLKIQYFLLKKTSIVRTGNCKNFNSFTSAKILEVVFISSCISSGRHQNHPVT